MARETGNHADNVCFDILFRLYSSDKIGRLSEAYEGLVCVDAERGSQSELRIGLSCVQVGCVGDG